MPRSSVYRITSKHRLFNDTPTARNATGPVAMSTTAAKFEPARHTDGGERRGQPWAKGACMGLLNAMQGFVVIGIIIGVGYAAARLRIGGPTAQMVLNRYAFFVTNPLLMFAVLSKEPIMDIFHPSIVVAFFSALAVGLLFLLLNRLFFHMDGAHATIGALNSLYLNSNNIGLPIATYILGDPALVAPILVMQQAVFTPIALTALDISTTGKSSVKRTATHLLHQPILLGSLGGIAVSAITAATGHYPIPKCIYDPIHMIGQAAVPMILMAFGMSLHGTKPLQNKTNRSANIVVTVLKNVVMPLIAFLIAYFMMGFRGKELYACVVLAALPAGQNVYNYAARYNVGTTFARDGVLLSTVTSPAVIAIIAALLG
jgi:malonate transporter and related proteins